MAKHRGQKLNANFFCTKFFGNPSGHGRPRRKSWTSAPKSGFSCGPGDGKNFLTPGHPGVRVGNVRRKFGPKSLCLCCFFFPEKRSPGVGSPKYAADDLVSSATYSLASGLVTLFGKRQRSPHMTLREKRYLTRAWPPPQLSLGVSKGGFSFPCLFGFPCIFPFQGIPCDSERFSRLCQGF